MEYVDENILNFDSERDKESTLFLYQKIYYN
jgi:hypothetical protein